MPPVMAGAIGAVLCHRSIYQARTKEKKELKAKRQLTKKKTLSDFAALEIILEQKAYLPGDKVKGIVNFYVKKDIPFAASTQLVLHFKGILVYHETEAASNMNLLSPKNKTSPEEDPIVHEHRFYNHQFVLDEGGILSFEKGVYSIPFSFKLHPKLPISLRISDDDVNFTCFYKLNVFWRKEEEEKLKFSLELPLVQKPPMLIVNSLISKLEGEYRKQICCFPKNKKALTLELFSSANVLKPNEELKGFCKLKMENISLSALFFKKIEIKIFRLCRIQFRGIHKKFVQTELMKQEFDITSKNCEQLTPETLKIEFQLNTFKLPSASTSNKYMKLVYVMTARPSGLNTFEKELKRIVKNQGYLHLMGTDEIFKKQSDKLEINGNFDDNGEMDIQLLLKKSQFSGESKESPSKILKNQNLEIELEEELRQALEKEVTTNIIEDEFGNY